MRLVGLSTAVAMLAAPLFATPITVTDAYHFVDRIGTNSFSADLGLYLTFGSVGVTPNSTGGTLGTYEQGSTSGALFDFSNSVRNEFAKRLPYESSLTGSWELTFTNGSDTETVNTPTVGTAMPADFVTDVAQIGSGLTPSFTWVPPAGVDRIQIYIRDLSNTVISGGSADLILVEQATGNSFTIPDGLLKDGGIYSIQIQGDNFRPDGSLLSRSRVYFDFTTASLPNTGGQPVFLPQTDTTSGTPIFNFDNQVVKDTLGYYDPIVAIGYDFFIGQGDPLFKSVLLPDIGDGIFDLFLLNASGDFDFSAQVQAGSAYTFGSGVEAFRILGIEATAGLDPNDPTAFVTGLSFSDDGRFTGSMTPISLKISAVPLPAAGWLFLGALALMVGLKRTRA